MNEFEKQMFASAPYNDRVIQDIELKNIEDLCTVVPGSRLYDVITTPIDKDLDKD